MASSTRGSRDALGSVLGILTFFGGMALLLITFKLAYGMFNTPPDQALGLQKGQKIDFNEVGPTLVGVIIRILLLIVMGIVGSLIANRGITLYTESRGLKFVHEEPVVEPPAASESA